MTQKWFSYPLNWISLLPPDKKLDFVRTGAIVRSYHRVMNSTEYATKPLVYRTVFSDAKENFL